MSAIVSRCRWMLCLGSLLLLVVQFSPVALAAATPTATLGPEEQAVWQLVAAARRDAGLSVPTTSDQITILARQQSTDMATRHYFSHYSPDGVTFLDLMPTYGITGQLAGETIQENNYADSPTEAARALIASPEHHAILFDPRFTIAGVGHAVGATGIHYFTIIVVQP